MEQYIDKSDVVAELEKLYDLEYDNISDLSCGKKIMLRHILLFLDTLEVKEINPTDAFICKARKYFYKELPNFRSFMESGTAFIKNFESFIQGE